MRFRLDWRAHDSGLQWSWRAVRVTALLLLLHSLSACAVKARAAHAPHEVPDYIVITDDVPNDAWICVPMMEWMAVTPNTIRCMPVATLRWMLRHQKKG